MCSPAMATVGSTSSPPACTRTCGSTSAGDWAGEMRKDDSSQVSGKLFPKGKGGLIFGNALFANRGGGRFDEVSDAVGVETYWPWGPSVDDFNADGWDDIFIAAGMNFPYRYGINSVLLNEGGHPFLPTEFVLGVEPRPHGTQQVWFTLECEGADRGHPLCSACAHPESMSGACRIDAAGHLTMMASRGTRSAVALDLDRKSTRLNSSHRCISYAVFCLK